MILNFSYLLYNGIFAVPSDVVDKYIKDASGDELKVFLYVFRHSNDTIELEKACEELGVEEKSFKSAINSWVKKGLFKCSTRTKKAKIPVAAEVKETNDKVAAQRILDTQIEYGQKDISNKIETNPEIKFLLQSVPDQLGRPISPEECSILVYLHEGAGIPVDVIVMLVGYCAGSSKGNIRFIKKMALSWADEGIDTYEKAENKIKELEVSRSFEGKVRGLLGINTRAITSVEQNTIDSWEKMNVSVELVKKAYEICVERTGKLAFPYMDGIIKSWNAKGIKTLSEVTNENKRGKKTKSSKAAKTPSFDIDEYVALSMKNLHNE